MLPAVSISDPMGEGGASSCRTVVVSAAGVSAGQEGHSCTTGADLALLSLRG